MKKLIILTLAFALILSTAAFASQTRVLTMGDNHVVLTDDANIWNWASRLNDYPHLAVGEFSNTFSGDFGSQFFNSNQFTQFGVHWQFGDDDPWVLATYFDNSPSNFGGFFGQPGGMSEPSSNQRIHALYARMMGTNKFGARVSIYHSSEKEEDTGEAVLDESYSYYEGQLSLTADDNSWDVAVTAGFGTWTDKLAFDSLYSEPDGLVDFAVLGRMFWGSGPNYQYVPHASLEYHKQGEAYYYNTTVLDETYKYSAFLLDLGIGQIYTPSSGVEAVIDVGVIFGNFKEDYTDAATPANNYEYKENLLTIPYFKLGLDAEVFSWLDLRLGAVSFWERFKSEDTQGATVYEEWENSAFNETFLGFGFHWGNLHIDTYTDPEIFLNGFDFISGAGHDFEEMNFQISAVYDLM